MNDEGGKLLQNLLLFGRLLRGLGLDVDTGRMIEVVQSLRFVEITDRTDFYHTLRCMLVHHQDDLQLFDRAFSLFWRKPPQNSESEKRLAGRLKRRRPAVVPPPLRQQDPGNQPPGKNGSSPQDEPPLVQATLTYSDREQLRHKNFADLTEEEVRAIQQLLASFIWQLGLRRTRRFQPGRGRTLDFRRTLRKNLPNGGEVLLWSQKEPRLKPRRLVILADISGSMERYTRLLLHFAYSLTSKFFHTGETFVFRTRLTRITRSLKIKNVEQALSQASKTVPDWSGGTRIGEALKSFNFNWGRRVLGHGAVVLLISDGWDRGDPILLREEISRLQRSCYRLVWLNPLLGSPVYEPLTRGMQTALPYIDDFLPVHNLASLEDLAVHLAKIREKPPVRRQIPRW
jgi:uncharacterized protein with von Willebrand factor type A (vWA) domain